ncbi:MAG: helix-turn-helix domain-containing protein [Candidatus Omnitrophica bacterium]|nr:helix-turn-helix domain-containing protein [Candidatus Omnitrophota bacterium]
MQSIGEQIKGLRQTLGMTQEQLAERSGLSQSMIADIENGRRLNLTTPTITKLAQGLNCHYVSQLIPVKDIQEILDEQSLAVARKIILTSSGSMAIEMQLPGHEVIEKQIIELKNQILKKDKSALWQKI